MNPRPRIQERLMSLRREARMTRGLVSPAVVCGLVLLSLTGCDLFTTAPPRAEPGQITQVSVINALMLGRYDGVMPILELLGNGDFGIGTLDHLDGELIVLDGQAFQARGDGVVKRVGRDRSTPFAVVTRFVQDGELPCPEAGSLAALDARLDVALAEKNNLLAIRIDGRFSSLTLRSVHRQETPYRPLGEVAKTQSVWTHAGVSGTMVGIRCPSWVEGLNVPGYHWHFLSDDRKVGDHVLDCRVDEGRVRYEVCRNWLVKLDRSAAYNREDLGKDLSAELRRVERPQAEPRADPRP